MIKELRVGNYVAYKGKPSLVCALDYDPKLRKENISVVYKWGEPPYKTNGDIQPILLTEKLVLQCGFNQLDDYTFDNDEMEITGKSSVRCPLKPSDSIPLCPNNPAH